MTAPAMPAAADPALLILQLRDDLIVVPQQFNGQPVYIVEDPLSGKFHRVGAREYAFLRCLNGVNSVTAAMQQVQQQFPHNPLSVEDALSLCRWLVTNELLRSSADNHGGASMTTSARGGKKQRRFNPLFVRIALCTPDPLLARLAPAVQWLHAPQTLVLTIGLLVWSLIHVLGQWDRFVASAYEVWSPSSRMQLVATWLLMKLAHEIAHGLVCKYYGGYVREAGVQFILFAPLPYVDVTSSWKFRSKWARIHTAIAGVYIELVLACIAACIWSYTDEGPIHQACAHIVVSVALATVLFNANPLMRGDGYYVLSDWLEIPNLAPLGRRSSLELAKRIIFGVTSAAPATTNSLIRIYGLAASLWRIVVSAGLLIAAARLFHGAGLAIAVCAGTATLFSATQQLRAYVKNPPPGERPSWRALAMRGSCGLAASALVLLLFPSPWCTSAPGIVEYSPPVVVRAGTAGMVEQLHVVSGQKVQAGDVLAVLVGRDLTADITALTYELAKTRLRCDRHRQSGEMALCQALERDCQSLESHLDERRRELDGLTVRAPAGGIVVARQLANLRGTYLEKGQEICWIGRESAKQVRLLVHQDHARQFELQRGHPVWVKASSGSVQGTLEQILPRATRELEYPALAATNHGPLAVRPVVHEVESSAAGELELVEPRMVAIVALSAEASRQLASGQTCTVQLCGSRDRLWTAVGRIVRSWYRQKTAATR